MAIVLVYKYQASLISDYLYIENFVNFKIKFCNEITIQIARQCTILFINAIMIVNTLTTITSSILNTDINTTLT